MKTFMLMLCLLVSSLGMASSAFPYPPAPAGQTCWAGKSDERWDVGCHFTDPQCYGSTSWTCWEYSNPHYITIGGGSTLTSDVRWLTECEGQGCTDRVYWDQLHDDVVGWGPFAILCYASDPAYNGTGGYVWTVTGQLCSPSSTITIPPGAKYTEAQKALFKTASVRMTATAAATTVIARAVPNPIWKNALLGAAALQSAGAALWAVLAIDPASPDFMTYVKVKPAAITPIVKTTGIVSAAQADVFNNWQTNQALMNAILKALNKTFDRIAGAADADDQVWVTNQATYYETLRLRLPDLVSRDSSLRQSFCYLPPKGVPSDFLLEFCNVKLAKSLKNAATELKTIR